MSKKILVYILYAIALTLMAFSIFFTVKEEDTHITFWIGLLISAIAMMMQEAEKKKENTSE